MSKAAVWKDHPLLAQLGQRVRAKRQEQGATIKALATEAGISERFLAELEAGRANISVVNLAQVAQVLAVPMAWLLEGTGEAVEPTTRHTLALLGLRGAGKSTLGKLLADKLSLAFFELDRLAEQETGMQLAEIFAVHGEEYFRRVELSALKRFLAEPRPAVLATGGGVVNSAEAFHLLLARTHTIWLKATPEEHWQRVVAQGDLRPMQSRPQAMTELRRRLKEREPLYAQASHICSTTDRSTESMVTVWAMRFGPRDLMRPCHKVRNLSKA
ncbi:MAG: shikimate kinase [Myxococcaceae bacterium]